MILPDTSIWTDHFRSAEPGLLPLLAEGRVLIHPFVIGELMLAGLHRRPDALYALRMLPAAPDATLGGVERLIEEGSLDGRGIGYVDATLLAAVRLFPDARLWTHDRKLKAVAVEMGIAFSS